jgi:hypothetical protein
MDEKKDDKIITAIHKVIKIMMDRVMDKVLNKDPFLPDVHKANKPLYAALVPDEIFKGSHFERRFVTPFGDVWERLACVVASNNLGSCAIEHSITSNVKSEQLRRITKVLNSLEHTERGKVKATPNWDKELNYILAGNGDFIPVTVVCDVFIEDKKNKKKYSFELKSPLPNSDITKVSKEKILKLYCMTPKVIDEAFFVLPYNPYGKKENYAWPYPGRWFDMKKDKVVLMGEEFWNMIGGTGTYQLFISEINKLGEEYKLRIYKEFLGLEPPDGIRLKVLE